MSEPVVSIQFNDKVLQEKFREISKKVSDPSELMEEIGQIVLLSTDQRWEKEIDPNGDRWAENSAYTRQLKQEQGRIDKILQSSGRARASINYKVDRDQVVIGTNVEYMVKHQLGTEGQKKREFLGISDEDKVEIAIAADEYLKRIIADQ
jgi:phage virion morphogenesis protein